MIDDDFIESVITPKTETTHTEKQTMITREFYGMEAVAVDSAENNFGKPVSASEKEGDD